MKTDERLRKAKCLSSDTGGWPRRLGGALGPVAWGAVTAALFVTRIALASGIPFSVIGPHEYTLPLHFSAYGEVVQSADVNANNQEFDTAGDAIGGPGGSTVSSSTKAAYLFQISALPSVGFEAELIEPAQWNTGSSSRATGWGDPVAGLVAWIKPSGRSTLGVQDYVEVPLGSRGVSAHETSNIFSVLGDYSPGRWDLDGDLGIVYPLSYRTVPGETTTRAGAEYFANLRGSYRVSAQAEPFLGVDWQNTAGSWVVDGGQPLAASSSNEFSAVAGLMWHLPAGSLSASWHYGLSGHNTVRTNSLLVRWIHVL